MAKEIRIRVTEDTAALIQVDTGIQTMVTETQDGMEIIMEVITVAMEDTMMAMIDMDILMIMEDQIIAGIEHMGDDMVQEGTETIIELSPKHKV